VNKPRGCCVSLSAMSKRRQTGKETDMSSYSTHPFVLTAAVALWAAVAVSSSEGGGFTISAHRTVRTPHGSHGLTVSLGQGASGVSFCAHPPPPRPEPRACRYVTRRTWVSGRWEDRLERRPANRGCGGPWVYVRVRKYVPGHYETVREHHPHCHCRHGGHAPLSGHGHRPPPGHGHPPPPGHGHHPPPGHGHRPPCR